MIIKDYCRNTHIFFDHELFFDHEIRRRPTDRREVITRIFFHVDLSLFYTHTDLTDLTDLPMLRMAHGCPFLCHIKNLKIPQ